jgi:hypothetical protein
MRWAEGYPGVHVVAKEDARRRRGQGSVEVVVLAQEWCRWPAEEPVHRRDGERWWWWRRRSSNIVGDLLDTLSSGWHWGLARVVAAVATAVQDKVTVLAAVCRTVVKNTAVAMAAVTVVTAEAAEAGIAAAESMVWTTTLPSEKTKECRSNGRQVHPCHFSYLSFFFCFLFRQSPELAFFSLGRDKVADNVL